MGVLHRLTGAFWIVGSIPLYSQKLLLGRNGRSVWQIITNHKGASNQPRRVKRHIYFCCNIKGRRYLPWLLSNLFVNSCYQYTGAYTHHDTNVNLDGIYSIASYSSTAAELVNQTFKVHYTFVSKQVKKIPRKGYWTRLIVLLLCIVIYGSLVSQ